MMRKSFAVVLLCAQLAACGGGDDRIDPSPSPVPSRISGVLFGTVTRNSQTFNMFALANAGRFMAVDDGGVFYDGAYTVSGGQVSGSGLRVYAGDPVGRPFIRQVSDATGTLSATVTTAGWVGSVGTQTGTISFDLGYELELDAQDSDLTFIDNSWRFTSATYQSVLTIQSGGSTATANTDNGVNTQCNSAGTASIIEASFGTYGWQTTVSGAGCGNLDDLPYTGFGLLSDGTDPLDTLTVFLANSNYFLAYRSYQRQ